MSEETTETQTKHPEELTFMDSELLKRYTTGTGKILPRKYTGLTAKQQRHVAKVIKRGRNALTTL
ncbi:MAG: 30S ribosomal protein S18 [Opitutales bacterium]|nr:30S ribosomal protein S18 [Opitutales bacterium]